jgi:hypothetical protein
MKQHHMGYLVVFAGNNVLSQEIYPISDFDQRVETGYFNHKGRYLGGIPRLRKTAIYAVCEEESSSGDATPGCTDWLVFEEGEKHSECACSDASCGEWTCTEYYTGTINNRCGCVDDSSDTSCRSWECEGSQVETVSRSRHGETTGLIISDGSFRRLDNSTSWNGVVSSSTRNSQEFCRAGASPDVLWECTRKTYRNCSTNDNIWCSFRASLVLAFVPLLIGGCLLVASCFCSMFYSFLLFIGLGLTLYGIVVSGGIYGIYAAVLVVGLIAAGSSVVLCRLGLGKS